MTLHNRSKKAVCAMQRDDDPLGAHRGGSDPMAVYTVPEDSLLEAAGYREPQPCARKKSLALWYGISH